MLAEPRTLLLVGHLPRNLQLLEDFLRKEGYAILKATTYEELDQVLNQQQAMSGSLIDLAGFDEQIWRRCEYLRKAKIPFLIFSPRLSTAMQQASLSQGARGVLFKPLIMKELIAVIRGLLEN